jgi:uncharacterized membrane protein (Fun14 family)
VCIVETQVSKERVEALTFTLGYVSCFAVKSKGKIVCVCVGWGGVGGLGVFWKSDYQVSLICFSQYHIDLKVKSANEEWRLTCVYGEAKRSERKKT